MYGYRGSSHSGSFPSSIASKLVILLFVTLAAAMVFVISSWPRLSPSRSSIEAPELLEFHLPTTTVPEYVFARVMNEGPKVNAAGASVGAATV
jgi:hypothetical protein